MNTNNSPSFTDSKEELEYYKFNFHKKEEELSKCLQKIKILEKINKKINNNFAKLNKIENNNNIKNISKSFNISRNSISSNLNNKNNYYKDISPNEFKNLWESIIQTELIDNFDFCINEYLLISYLCQDIIMLVYNESQNEIQTKFNQVLTCLNLDKISKSKINFIYKELLPLFRENSNNIFIFRNSLLDNIHKKLISIIKEYNYNKLKVKNDDKSLKFNNKNNKISDEVNVEMPILLETKINDGLFDNLIKSFYKICIYMILHDPVLSFHIEQFSERKFNFQYYNKNNFINVEGFGNEQSPCILLLPPPLLKNKYPFNGLRPAVYIIYNPDNNIKKECEINKAKMKEETNKKNTEEKTIENDFKCRGNEPKNIKLRYNLVYPNITKMNGNNIKLRNRKNDINENDYEIESFNFTTGFNNNKNINSHDLQDIKVDKIIISNSLGNIFNKNNKVNNKYKDRNILNKKYKNKKDSKISINNRKKFIPNMNFISIKQISNNSHLIITEKDKFIHNFKDEIIINNNLENKTPFIERKYNNIYRPLCQSFYIDRNNNNLIDLQDPKYNNNYFNEKMNDLNQKEKIDYDIFNNNRIDNDQYNDFSTIRNPDNYHTQFYSEVKYYDKNKRNTSFYLSSNNKPFRKTIDVNFPLENKLNNHNINNSNLYDNFNFNNKHSYNTIVFNSYNNNYKNINNSNNFQTRKKNSIINLNKNKFNNLENIKLQRQKNKKIKTQNIINNDKNINILYLKNNKNFNINLNTSEINKNNQYNNNKLSNNSINKFNIDKIEDKEVNINDYNIMNQNLNNEKIAKIKLYVNNKNKADRKKKERIKNINQGFIMNHDENDDNNDDILCNSLNDIFYLNNSKNRQYKTIDNEKLIKKQYINRNTSYNNIFFNDENNYNNEKNHKKIINYSNLYDSNYHRYDYNNYSIYQKTGRNSIDKKKKYKINHLYGFKKIDGFNNNFINSSFPNLYYDFQHI